ncbi:MAG: hypothetical protein OXH70_17270 [Acidobacteria bacterium]|nr:hypothetical protein [Acidobacteriota bacterium]
MTGAEEPASTKPPEKDQVVSLAMDIEACAFILESIARVLIDFNSGQATEREVIRALPPGQWAADMLPGNILRFENVVKAIR